MEFQTRSEKDGLALYSTLKLALAAADLNSTIWKISFSLQTGERVRLVKNVDKKFELEILSLFSGA